VCLMQRRGCGPLRADHEEELYDYVDDEDAVDDAVGQQPWVVVASYQQHHNAHREHTSQSLRGLACAVFDSTALILQGTWLGLD
jgi:hypothetical protein